LAGYDYRSIKLELNNKADKVAGLKLGKPTFDRTKQYRQLIA